MNIAIIENHLISVITVRRKLIETLIDKGHQIKVFTTGSDQELLLASEIGFSVVDIGASDTNPKNVLRYLTSLKKELQKFRPEVCLTFTMRPAIWGNLITRTLKIPTVTNITGTGPLSDSNSYIYRVARTLYRFILKKTKVVFFQNTDDREIFINNGYISSSQAVVIPGSGIEVDKFLPASKEMETDKFSFLFISRLLIDKGTLEYVEACRNLNNKFADKVSCHMVGPFWDQNYKSNTITKANVESWTSEGVIKYHGAATDVRPFIINSDCVVLPSYREGMSNVLLEAASMARPSIACNVTGCKDIIEDGITGFLCKVKNVEDLTKKMETMMNLPKEQRDEMGIRARGRMIRYFDKSIVINAYLKAINEAVS